MKIAIVVFSFLLMAGCRTNESPEAQVGDLEISTQVKARLAKEVGMSTVTNVAVNSTNGIVTLSGQVDTPDIKSKAEEVAKTTPKVASVVDNIQIAPAKP